MHILLANHFILTCWFIVKIICRVKVIVMQIKQQQFTAIIINATSQN